jgi:hypothetical protein
VIQSHEELEVYQMAFKTAMRIFELSKSFPPEERYALTDQIRRSGRSVCSNIAEAWRKRRYEAAFVSKPREIERMILSSAIVCARHLEGFGLIKSGISRGKLNDAEAEACPVK